MSAAKAARGGAKPLTQGSLVSLAEMIEKRRFVGREFLVWLWFESELFEATLRTADHGEIGFWVEGSFALSAGKETTKIRGSQPAASREAKESMLRGKLPESAGLHVHWKNEDLSFSLKAESLAIASFKPHTVLGEEEHEAENELLPPVPRKRPSPRTAGDEHDQSVLVLAERMQATAEFEALVEALFRDFLQLRLSDAWEALVLPAINAWLGDEEVDEARYRRGRKKALGH